MRKQNLKLLIPAVVILLAAAFYFAGGYFFNRADYTSYKDFWAYAQEEKINSVQIESDKIFFTLKPETFSANSSEKDGSLSTDTTSSSKKFYTENPSSPVLAEELLKLGIPVKIQKDTAEIISLIFDIFFYIFFFGVILIAFRKFISPNTFKVVHNTGVKFDDVVGMEKLKKDMIQVMDIMKNPVSYAKKGIRMPKGILMEGEPGNGKTLFAKALAGEAKINFIPAKATDFESMFMAIGPLKVKLLFKKARRRAPCIVFIDEFDGIGTVRNYSGSAIETENTRIVTALLNELDGFEHTNGVLVIAATNSIKALDPALIRPGRFDAKITVPYPDEEARRQLVKMYTKGKSPAAECTPETLSKMFKGYSCAKIESILNSAAMNAAQKGKSEFTLEDIREAEK